MALKVLVVGGIVLDTIISYEEMQTMVHQKPEGEVAYLLLEEGHKIEVSDQQSFSGGGASNAAASFSALGHKSALFAKVGEDLAAQQLLSELKAQGIDTQYVVKSLHRGTGTSFVVPSLSGDRTLFAYRGANTTLSAKDFPWDVLKEQDLLYVSSLSNQAAQALPDMIKHAKDAGVKVAVNPGVSQLKQGSGFLKDALFGIDILVMNVQEAQLLMATLVKEDDAIAQAVHESVPGVGKNKLLDSSSDFKNVSFSLRKFFALLLTMGPKVIAVTDGAEGAYVANDEQIIYHAGIKTKVVNTLGAGDAFSSTLAAGISSGMDIKQALCYAVAQGASVVEYADAKSGLLAQDALDKKIRDVQEDLITSMLWHKA